MNRNLFNNNLGYLKCTIFQIEVVTGEENETVLYGHVAKLYRFTSCEWKERGKGVVTILKHKDTGKLRYIIYNINK